MDWNELGLEALKLLLAGAMGAALGWEREAHGRHAGLRTNILIGLGSCLLMMLSLHMEELFRGLGAESAVRLDPGRVASYAIAGMGFIGAGVIVKGRGSVRGVTTAATLWTLTGVGLSMGAGFYFPAILTTALAYAALHTLRRVHLTKDEYTGLNLTFSSMARPLDEIRGALSRFPGIRLQGIDYNMDLEAETVTYRLYLRNPSTAPVCVIMDELMLLPELKHISWEKAGVP